MKLIEKPGALVYENSGLFERKMCITYVSGRFKQ